MTETKIDIVHKKREDPFEIFEQDMELLSIVWDEQDYISVGDAGCISLTVREQRGEYSMVPWVLAVYEDGTEYVHNMMLLQSVRIK